MTTDSLFSRFSEVGGRVGVEKKGDGGWKRGSKGVGCSGLICKN